MKLRWWLLAVYLLLLLGSHLVRWRSAAEPVHPEPSLEVRHAGSAGPAVRIAYQEWGPESDAPTLLLLHGSPGSSNDFAALAPLLEHRFRLIAPDLPGFGRSSRVVADYSIRAHAEYVETLSERLGLREVHVVGFSMGGGVALELVRRAPDLVASVTLLASIGLQEFELLGNHQINHAIHAAQLAALFGLHEAVPHFGVLDGSMLAVPYARNFFDTDQRPLRGVLESLEPPVLILHGASDPLVPVAAAREHHRIVPQSELIVLDTDHFTIFREPELLAGPLADFVARVERGEAADRGAASGERLEAAAEPFDSSVLPRAEGLTAFVWVILLALASLVSEDLTCISAGVLVAQGRIGFLTAVFACSLGIFLGDLALFAAGRFLGRPWIRRRPLRWFVSEERIDSASDWFRRRGPAVILLSRFTPGMRLPTYFAAGLLRTSLARFVGYFALAVAVWTPILVGISALVGVRAVERLAGAPRAAFLLIVLVVALWFLVKTLPTLATWRGRRLWVGTYRRWQEWEFWPAWLFYIPVVVRLLGLGLRYRSLTLFTAANPALPAGGFVGESKSQILSRLPTDAVARFAVLPAGQSRDAGRQAVESLLNETGQDLPVVLKPDVGERGHAVLIAHSWQDVEDYLENAAGDTLVQEHIEGPELGVFYVRHPAEAEGRIFSVTEKLLPSIVGDGRSTVERLILADPRAVCQAPMLLGRHHERLHEIPQEGEEIALVEIGTHCRGAVFRDGSRFRTPELTREIERISRHFEGFYFGRYDLRAPSEEALRDGRDLKVLELNGVTSEATHIYDPSLTLGDAYGVLFEQWRLAFEIGAANRERGVSPTSLGALIGIVKGWLFRATPPGR